MKKTTITNFAGLTYVTISNIPLRKTDLGDVIDIAPGDLEVLVAIALIENKIPVRGSEFRLMKSALGLSNEAIANELGISRNTVLKWGKNLEERLPMSYEMLFRLLVAESLGAELEMTMAELRAADKVKRINIKAAS